MTTSFAIEANALAKVYFSGVLRKRFVGLSALDLKVQAGEIYGFVGPNGAGKTTAIKCMMGLQRPTEGSAKFFGRDTADPAARQPVGFLSERPYFYDHVTPIEILLFYGQLFDLSRSTCKTRAQELVERVGLAAFADVPLREFSKGMLQRVGLAQALINAPRLLVLDEPMSGLDPVGRMLVRDILLEERTRGVTIFFSSHILSDVESISDRVGVLVGGRLVKEGLVSDLVGQRAHAVDCIIELDGDLALSGREINRRGSVRIVRVAPDEVDSLLGTVLEAGGKVRRVQPVGRSLEEVLLEEIEAAAPTDRRGVLA
jgi:ABC-2 type transport system ATP-binding protein